MLFAKIFVVVCVVLPVWSDGLDQLFEDLESDKATTRSKAILAIGPSLTTEDEALQKKIAESLINAIADKDTLVSHSARFRIAEHTEIVNRYLKPYFEPDAGYKTLGRACETIKVIGSDAKIWLPDLIKRLDRDDRNTKLAALHAMGALDGKDLLPALDKTIEALDHKDFNVQLSACRVLSKIGPDAKKAGPRLVMLLEEGIASARSWASIALGAIGPHDEYDVVKLLEERLDRFYLIDRERALIGLSHLGEKAKTTLPKIEKLMADESKSVQHTAARTHWKISGDSKQAVERLIKLVPTMEYGVDSMDILGEIGIEAKSAVPAMIKQLESSEFPTREAAVYGLASIGPDAESAIEPLKKLNESEQDVLIKAAIELALRKINNVNDEDSNDR